MHGQQMQMPNSYTMPPNAEDPGGLQVPNPYGTMPPYGEDTGGMQMPNPYGAVPPYGEDPGGGWGMQGMPGDTNTSGGGWNMHGAEEIPDEFSEMPMGHVPQPVPDGPCVVVPALSLRQPFASLALYGVKQLEARNRPALKPLSGPLALHVSHREEPFGSPLVSTAVAILRRRFSDDQISSLFALPQTHAQGHGCIVGIVDVEATWP
jgi:hypothetical protein